MNIKLENFKREIKNKKVAVLGVGVSNKPLIKYLVAIGVEITAFDRSDPQKLHDTIEDLKEFNIKYSLGEGYLENLKGFDVIFKTPVVRYDIPELINEMERGAVITSEMEVFCDLCPAKIFAVTGSDGKTTTTTLIYKILNEQGYKCWLGGNIGTPLIDRIDEVQENDMVVLELSSFQLHTMKNRINVAVITNLSPNHLDIHKSMEEYVDAKKNIFRYQNSNDIMILNYDNLITRDFSSEASGNILYFSRTQKLKEGMFIEEGMFVYKKGTESKKILKADDILLPGEHNVENYLAAAAATVDFVDAESIRKVAASFKGVEHRIEHVRELKGISFYNDSIGTSPTRAIASIKSFKQKVILIAGGYDKHIPFDEMGEVLVEKVKCLVLIGATAPLIEKALLDEVERRGIANSTTIIKCKTLEEAVNKAYQSAVGKDIIIMSPSSASFDMFKNFEEKGKKFKEIVNNLE